MLGRKAILHSTQKGKKKWQLEQEKIRKTGSSDSELSEEENGDDAAEDAGTNARNQDENKPAEMAENRSESEDRHRGDKAKRERGGDDDDESEESGGAGKKKRFAWMDSDDEVSEGGEDGKEGLQDAEVFANDEKPSGTSKVTPADADLDPAKCQATPATASTAPAPANASKGVPLPPSSATSATCAVASSAALAAFGLPAISTLAVPANRPGMLRPLRPPLVLPPSTKLPVLTQAHMQLMGQVAGARSLDDLWDVIDRHYEDFAASHAAIALQRLTYLAAATTGGDVLSAKLDKHVSFLRLCDRLDDLVAAAEGRSGFIAADLAMVSTGLAKVVPAPATSGAIGRIFAELADETESRLASEPLAFTLPMLGDIAWGIAKTGNARQGFLRVVISAVVDGASGKRRMSEATCQDLASFADAFADQTFDEAEDLLRLIIDQARERLAYVPPPSSPLNGVTAVPLPPTVAIPLSTESQVPPPDGVQVEATEGKAEYQPFWQLTGQWKFTGSQMSEIASSVAKHIGLYDEKLFNLVAQSSSTRLQDFTVPQLQKLRDAFDLVRHDRDGEFMQAVRTSLKQREFAVRRGSGGAGSAYIGRR